VQPLCDAQSGHPPVGSDFLVYPVGQLPLGIG
jgi:hypothetical protein